MDSGGNIYASKALAEALEQATGRPIREMRPAHRMPRSAIPIEDDVVARSLAQLNNKARRVFYSQRRRGVAELEALWAAEATLDPGKPRR
jgi:hypothetical protein